MRIGIRVSSYDRWGKERYNKMREHGFSCADYTMFNTTQPLYECSESELIDMLSYEKELATAAGVEI